MGFLNKLFGNKYQELHDEQLGVFRKLSNNGSIIIWTGTADFLNSAVTIFIAGTETQLDENEKIIMLDTLTNSFAYSNKCDDSLRIEFENAEKSYSTWADCFDCISISTINNEVKITFEEKETQYHFNVIFEDRKAVGVSIDS